MDEFSVKEWLAKNSQRESFTARLSQPQRLGVGWTKQGVNYAHGDASGLAALQQPLPTAPVDLNPGLAHYTPKCGSTSAPVEIVLREAFAANTASLESCDVLTFRNNLNKIFGTVFSVRDAWMVDACLLPPPLKNSSAKPTPLFLDIVKHEEDERELMQELQKFMAWGFIFESVCTGESHTNANNEYGALITWNISFSSRESGATHDAPSTKTSETLRVYMGAEIDAFDPGNDQTEGSSPDAPPPIASFREIKTYTQPTHPGQYRTLYRHRHPKWWLQSYLAGTTSLILGARDPKGIVREIHTVATADLPRISWAHNERWSPEQAIAFGANVLTWMRDLGRKYSGRHLRFTYDPQLQSISAAVVDDGDLPGRLEAALSSLNGGADNVADEEQV